MAQMRHLKNRRNDIKLIAGKIFSQMCCSEIAVLVEKGRQIFHGGNFASLLQGPIDAPEET
jgi:hypothetical protein